ncbi:hypothetical protein ACQJBY_008351 [Aegilops geniculata]
MQYKGSILSVPNLTNKMFIPQSVTINPKGFHLLRHTCIYLYFLIHYLQISNLHTTNLRPIRCRPVFFDDFCCFTFYVHVLVHLFHGYYLIRKGALLSNRGNKRHI